jgi:hypothetical protein
LGGISLFYFNKTIKKWKTIVNGQKFFCKNNNNNLRKKTYEDMIYDLKNNYSY